MILGVKSGTPDDIIFTEINRPDLISKIYQRQFKFYLRFQSMTDISAAKKIWTKFQQLGNYSEKPYLKHYENLSSNITNDNISSRLNRIRTSNKSMTLRYFRLFNCQYNKTL